MPGATVEIQIVPMQQQHRCAVARLHRLALPQAFLSSFGDRFLGELYWGIANARRSGVWVAIDESGGCVGFVSGTADLRDCYRQVLVRRGPRLMATALRRLLSPSTMRRVLETASYPLRKTSPADESSDRSRRIPELLSIAVDAGARGLGVGKRLVATLEGSLTGWSAGAEYRVVTHAADPRSNLFYLRTGFRPAGSFRHHEHEMNLYLKSLETSRQGSHEP